MEKLVKESSSANERFAKTKEIVIALAILLISVVIAYLTTWFGASKGEAVIVGIGCALLGYIFDLRYNKLADLSGQTILMQWRTVEQKILAALKLAVGSEEVSRAIHDNIIEPTVRNFIVPERTNDVLVKKLLTESLSDYGRNLSDSVAKGLPVKHYLVTLKALTETAKIVRATSLLPPSIWLADTAIQEYTKLQLELFTSKKIRTLSRLFIVPVKFMLEEDWCRLSGSYKGIEFKRYIKDKIENKNLLDFVIFDNKGVLVSQTLTDLIISNDIDSIQEFKNRWNACSQYINAFYIFSPPIVEEYISLYDELMLQATN